MGEDSTTREGGLRKAPAFLQHTAAKGRVKGYFQISGPLLAGQEPEGETVQCVHCQKHWRIRPGSGMQRGFCANCNGPTCGKQQCETRCTPFEQAIEAVEQRDRNLELLRGR